MNKKEAAQVVAILKASYPNHPAYRNLTAEDAQGIVAVWSMHFADVSAEVVLLALNKWVSTNQHPPSISEINDKISSVSWDAYGKLEQHYRLKHLSEEMYEYYRRIHKETERFKYKNNEFSIGSMFPKKYIKQIERDG